MSKTEQDVPGCTVFGPSQDIHERLYLFVVVIIRRALINVMMSSESKIPELLE